MAKEPKADIAGTYKVVPIEQLREREDNPNRQSKAIFAQLIQAIRDEGFTDPVIVRSVKGGYEILSGAHRVRAAAKLRMAQVPVVDLGAISEIAARKKLIRGNELHGAPDEDALAAVIQNIRADGGDDAIQSLGFDDVRLAELLDDLGDDHLPDEQAEPPPEDSKNAKIRPADVALAVLELEGVTQSGLKSILKAFRKWRATKDAAVPAWEHIIELIRKDA
jgi:ParB-like chromosome segregation protein Spo0J